MNKEIFTKGITTLEKTYNREIPLIIAWECLRDMDDEAFTRAIFWMIKNISDVYPGTNLIALIRQHTLDQNAKMIRDIQGGLKAIEYKWPTQEESEEFLKQLRDAIK